MGSTDGAILKHETIWLETERRGDFYLAPNTSAFCGSVSGQPTRHGRRLGEMPWAPRPIPKREDRVHKDLER